MTARRLIAYLAGLLVLTVLVSCVGAAWIIEVAGHLAFGWIANLREALPRVEVNSGGVALFVLTLPALAWLTHGSGRWLAGDRWRWKWTLLGLAMVLLMFVAGIAATGVVHQTGWLIRSPVPLLENSRRNRYAQARCAVNLRRIGNAIASYFQAGGERPRSFDELARLTVVTDLSPDEFVCPATEDERLPSTNPSEWGGRLTDHHFSYVVCPDPIPGPAGQRVILYDRPHNHKDGLNVLYDDGQVEWLDRTVADNWLATVVATSQPITSRHQD
ncbi:MAG: hypothetical protein QM754_08490 [Tepidisphaeraceae bacterium]